MMRKYQAPRILIVEDEAVSKTILVKIFSSLGFGLRYTWAVSAEDALDELREKEFQLIVADVMLLGEKTGFDLWSHCQIQYPRTPFLMVSSLLPDAYENMIGANEIGPLYMQKPFAITECRQLLESLIAVELRKEVA